MSELKDISLIRDDTYFLILKPKNFLFVSDFILSKCYVNFALMIFDFDFDSFSAISCFRKSLFLLLNPSTEY